MTAKPQRPLRIGTRKSALALVQAEEVRLALHHKYVNNTEFTPIVTSGDKATQARLADIGGKALFTKEIEEALLREEIDIAVHSLKDVPALMPEGLIIAATLPRRDARDVLVSNAGFTLDTLPHGAKLGTSSPRRAAQMKMKRPDIEMVPLRGNVPTRLEKIRKGEADATLLALAGLLRLNMLERQHVILSPESFLPAASQGIIGIQCRENDAPLRETLSTINDTATFACAVAERAVLEALGGSCYTPVAAYARLQEETMILEALLISEDGREHARARREGNINDARELGLDAGQELRRNASSAICALLEG